MPSSVSDLQRLRLDRELEAIRAALPNLRKPRGGWMRTIRSALGMTVQQLARRAGISQPTMTELEKSEAAGRIRLDTLTRIADALDCEVVYALVPRRPLSVIVSDRRKALALERYRRTAHSMALENQLDESSSAIRDAKLDAVMKQIRPRELWQDE
jgi:predicted DNA-binding mobile mystery protein A